MSTITTPASAAVAERFRELARQWKASTSLLSSTSAMVAEPTYQAIIALGPSVVPLILKDLEREPAHWFEALRAITGEDPVPVQDWGKVPAMCAAWLAWGRCRGLV